MSTSTALHNLATWSVTLADDVLFQELDDDAVLLSIKTGEYFGLNHTGAHMWQAITNGVAMGEALESLAVMYEVDRTTIAEDVIVFLQTLADMGLLTIDTDAA